MADNYEIKQNDLAEIFENTLKRNGAPIDLTAAEEVLMHMVKKGGGLELKNIAQEVTNASGGEIAHQWQSGENAVAGDYEYEFEIIWTAEKRNTSVPNKGTYTLTFNPELA